MSMTDQKEANVLWLQSVREDVEQFIDQCDWKNAQAGIDAMRENGHFSSADILRKKLLEAQFVYAEDMRFVPCEDVIPLSTERTVKTDRAEVDPRMEAHEDRYQSYKAQV